MNFVGTYDLIALNQGYTDKRTKGLSLMDIINNLEIGWQLIDRDYHISAELRLSEK